MKKTVWLMLATILVFGCSRHHGIRTGDFAASFRTADPTVKIEADAVIKYIKDGKLPDALAELQILAKRAKLSAEQQQAVKDLIQQISAKMETDAKKAAQKKP